MDKQISLTEFSKLFGSELACIKHLEKARWPNGVRCLKCDSERISEFDTKGKTGKTRHLYDCMDCGYQFSVTVGTVMHDSHVPLTKWFFAIRLMVSAKKGVSSRQLARELAVGVETAWYMSQRIRVAMKGDMPMLTGIVEVDETYVGGKDRNKHKNKRGGGRGGAGKAIVVGAIERNGRVVAKVIDRADKATMTRFVQEAVSTDVSVLATDEHKGYRLLRHTHGTHEAVNHSKGEYVVGAIHTNTIEGFWSILKRGIIGSFHKVSKKYLPLYVAEFQFRYNNRKDQRAMFDTVLTTCF